jgi:transcriptional regulatory protein LevR
VSVGGVVAIIVAAHGDATADGIAAAVRAGIIEDAGVCHAEAALA